VTAREVARWLLVEAWGNGKPGRTPIWAGPDRGGACGKHPAGWTGSITRAGLARRLLTLPAFSRDEHER